MAARVLFGLMVALAGTLAFEPIRAVWSTGWFEVNHLKLLVAGCAGVGALDLVRCRSAVDVPAGAWLGRRCVPRAWRLYRPVVLAGAAFLLAATASALLAESFRSDAL